MNVYLGPGPDWTSVVTAVSTALLVVGIFFAGVQFFWQRKSDRVVQSDKLIDCWNECKRKSDRDKLEDYEAIEANRADAIKNYINFCNTSNDPNNIRAVLQESAKVAERIEIYVRRGAASESIIAEAIGYEVLHTYYVLHNIIEARAKNFNFDYEGFRDLALRVQHYARLNPDATGFATELMAVPIPIIHYKEGTDSKGYMCGITGYFRLARLGLLGYMYDLKLRKKPFFVPEDLGPLEASLAHVAGNRS